MKALCVCVALHVVLSTCHSQVVTVDSLFMHGLQHHAEGMRFWLDEDKTKALKEFDTATDMLREYQDAFTDGMKFQNDSLVHLFEMLQQREPQSPVNNYLLGRIIQNSSADAVHAIAAISYFNKSIDVEPRFPWSYFALAQPFISAQDYPHAIELYKKAIAADPAFGPAYDALIRAYHELGEVQDSINCEKQLMEKCSRSFDANFRRFQNCRRENDVDAKIRIYRDIIAHSDDPEDKVNAYVELINTFAIENRLDSAETMARQTLRLTGSEYRKLRQYAYLVLFRDAAMKGVTAVNAVAAEVLQTTDPYVHITLGKYYRDSLHMNQQALTFIRKAYQYCTKEDAYNTLIVGPVMDQSLEMVADKYRSFVSYELGLTYLNAGEYEEAEEYLIQAATGADSANIVDANFRLGSLFIKENQKENAIKWLAKGLSLQANEKARNQLVGLLGSEEKAQNLIEAMRKTNERPAPNFTLYSIDGDSVRLSSFRGKIVVIDFWATWCHPWVAEIPFLRKIIMRYAKNPEVLFLSVSIDKSRDAVKPFVERHEYGAKVLYDEGTAVDYGVEIIPCLFLIDRRGKIEFNHVGFNGEGVQFVNMLEGEIDELLTQDPDSK